MASNRQFSLATLAEAVAGTNDSKIVTPLGVYMALQDAIGAVEVSSIDCAGVAASALRGKFVTLGDRAGPVHVFFDRADVSDDPGISGRQVPVDLPNGGGFVQPRDVARLTAAALNVGGALVATAADAVLTLADAASGARTNAAAGTSGAAVSTTVNGVTGGAGNGTVTIAPLTTGLAGRYFYVLIPGKVLVVWFDHDGNVGTAPAVGQDRSILVDCGDVSENGTIWATALATALAADPDLNVSRVGLVVTISQKTSFGAFEVVDADASLPGTVTLATLSAGGASATEISRIDFGGLTAAGLRGKYMTLADAAGAVVVWFRWSDSGANSRGIACISAAGTDTGATLAETLKLALDADPEFSAGRVGSVVTVTARQSGIRRAVRAEASGLTVARVTAGAGLQSLRSAMCLAVDQMAAIGGSGDAFTVFDGPGANFTRNGASWLTLPATHVPTWSNAAGGAGLGALVSPRHLICANHFPLAAGETVRFVTAANVTVTRTIAGQTRIGATDIRVCSLNADVPAGIDFARVMPANWRNWIPSPGNTPKIPLVNIKTGRYPRVFDLAIVKHQTDAGGSPGTLGLVRPISTERLGFYSDAVGGDSGSALFGYVNGVPVLFGAFFGGVGTPTYQDLPGALLDYIFEGYPAGSMEFITAYLSEINAAMIGLGGGYRLTAVDLSHFIL